MRWLKHIFITVVALHIMLAPDVCLMMCCHAPTASVAAEDESHLPPCHRKQAKKVDAADVSHLAFHAPCGHVHDTKPAAWQRASDENSISLLAVALASTPLAWQGKNERPPQQLRFIQPTTSPPFRERNLPLRI